MRKRLVSSIFTALLLILSSNAYAAFGSKGTSSSPVFFSAGTGISMGTLAASNLNLDSRSMVVYGLNSDLGLRFGSLKAGLGVEYNFWMQLKDPADLGGTNAQGKEFSLAPVVGYDFGIFSLNLRYYLSSKYSFDKADSSGNKVAFLSPKTSFAVDVKIPFKSGTPYIGLQYKKMKYGKTDVGGTESELASGNEMTTSSYGASVGFAF